MRVKNSFKNMVTSIVMNITNILIGLVAQAIFIKTLGNEYLGLNSLFLNIISMLSIAELGLGNAIIYNLYKPIADNDVETQKSLMHFYKKSYRIIGILILIVGMLVIPLLPFIVGENTLEINIGLAYILFLLSVVLSYFLSYKRSILYANEKNYILNIIHIIYIIIFNALQIIILFLTKDYYLYLIIKIIMTVVENLIITFIANKLYGYLKDKDIKPLNKTIKKDIYKKIKAMFFHKIGSFIVLGTDNILISKFLGLVTVGLYSNYYIIINSVKNIFFQIIQATTASVGNLLVTETKDKQFEIFKKIRFTNFWLSTFSSCALLIIMESFIKIWIGDSYLLATSVLIILVINYYFFSSRATFYAFKDAACLYYEDRFVPLVEALTNIVFSIIFIKFFGLSGVFLGTIVSSFWLCFYSYPKYVYKKLFERSYIDYFKETIGYILVFFVILIISYTISKMFIFDNKYIELLKNCFVSLVVPNIMLILLFYRTNNFKYFLNLFKKRIKRQS